MFLLVHMNAIAIVQHSGHMKGCREVRYLWQLTVREATSNASAPFEACGEDCNCYAESSKEDDSCRAEGRIPPTSSGIVPSATVSQGRLQVAVPQGPCSAGLQACNLFTGWTHTRLGYGLTPCSSGITHLLTLACAGDLQTQSHLQASTPMLTRVQIFNLNTLQAMAYSWEECRAFAEPSHDVTFTYL